MHPRDPNRTYPWLRDRADRVVAFEAAERNRLAIEKVHHRSTGGDKGASGSGAHVATPASSGQTSVKPCFSFARTGKRAKGKACTYSHDP